MNGTGPFKLVEWVNGDHITAARTPTTGSGLPYLDEVNIKVFSDQPRWQSRWSRAPSIWRFSRRSRIRSA
jgi:ABC-type transport system substrate-binding protein